MAQIRFHKGQVHMVDHTPAANVAAGDVVLVGSGSRKVPCIALQAIAAGEAGAVAWPSSTATYRVHGDLTYRLSEDVFATADPLYVESDGATFTDTATDNLRVGTVTALQDDGGGNVDHVAQFVHEV